MGPGPEAGLAEKNISSKVATLEEIFFSAGPASGPGPNINSFPDIPVFRTGARPAGPG